MRIVQLANFYGPRSGGLRTALHHLGSGYGAQGHEVVLVVPGRRSANELLPTGIRRITVAAPRLPGTGGYRAVDPWRVQRLLERLRPDAIEVSDRLTLRGLGAWAARHGVPSVVISHERLDRLLAQFLLPAAAARHVADVANARTAAAYDTVVCTTSFARAEFDRRRHDGAGRRRGRPARGGPGARAAVRLAGLGGRDAGDVRGVLTPAHPAPPGQGAQPCSGSAVPGPPNRIAPPRRTAAGRRAREPRCGPARVRHLPGAGTRVPGA